MDGLKKAIRLFKFYKGFKEKDIYMQILKILSFLSTKMTNRINTNQYFFDQRKMIISLTKMRFYQQKNQKNWFKMFN